MIESTLTGNFGVNVEEGVGVILNMQVGVEHIIHIPFQGGPLLILLKEMVKGLNDEQKRELIPLITGGIIIPKNGDFKPGPQG